MTIAAHITESGSDNDWLFRQLILLAQQQPNHQFVLIYDNPDCIRFVHTGNVQSIVLSPVIKNRLLRHFWYQYKLPALLQRINSQVFVCDDLVCILKSKYKQVLVYNQLNKSGAKIGKKKSYQLGVQYLRKYISTASLLICFDIFSKQRILSLLPGKQLPVQIIHPGFDLLAQRSDEQIDETKSLISEGCEYFLMPVTSSSLAFIMKVVKAFSAFKKRQKSGMKLILQLLEPTIKESLPDFKNYKYLSDLLLVAPENKQTYLAQLASAYACVYLTEPENLDSVALDIVALNVPMILTDEKNMQVYFQDAVIYCEPETSAIAEILMELYRNEKYRKALLARANEFVLQNTAEKTAGKLWDYLEETAAQSS